MVFWGSLAYGIGVLAVPRLSPTWLWALMPWLGICSAVMFVPSLLWLLKRARGIGRKTTMASFHAAGSLGFLLGPVCCGALVDLGGGSLAGYEIAFTVAGLSVVAGAWLVRRDAPGSRGRP